MAVDLPQAGEGRTLNFALPWQQEPFGLRFKEKEQSAHTGLAPGHVPPAWHGPRLVSVCSGRCSKLPRTGGLTHNRH